MRNFFYIFLIFTSLIAGGCSGSNHLVSSEEGLSEALQRNYFNGTQHLLKGDKEAAYTCFLRCSDEEPDIASFHYDLGKIDFELGRMEAALAHLDLAVDIDEENDWFRYYRGKALAATGNLDEAAKDFEIWIAKRPGDLEALRECSDVFLKEGKAWHAYQLLAFYEDEIAPNVEVRLDKLMLILISEFEFEKFDEFLSNAANDFPDEPKFIYHKGLMAFIIQEYESAISILEGLARSHPNYMEGVITLSDAYFAVGMIEEAYELKLEILKSDEVDPHDKLLIIDEFFLSEFQNKGGIEAFEGLLEIAVEIHPRNAEIMHYAGLHWYNKGDLTRAEFALQVAVLEDPSSLKVHLDYLGIIHDLKHWEVLIEAGEQASLVFPLEPLIFLYYGNGHKELKHYKEAITLFKNGLAVLIDAPKTRAALLNELAFSYREFGEKEESYDTFEKSLIHNSSPYVMNNHAYYLATDNQRIQDALKWSTKANELVPNEPNFMDTQALILHLLVRNSDALDWIVEAQALLNSPEAVFLEREGDIRYSLGESERAFELWERAIVAGGGKTRLNEKLNRPVIGKE